jgi:hypothetical protein
VGKIFEVRHYQELIGQKCRGQSFFTLKTPWPLMSILEFARSSWNIGLLRMKAFIKTKEWILNNFQYHLEEAQKMFIKAHWNNPIYSKQLSTKDLLTNLIQNLRQLILIK